jgi:predicted enzyme related to lactoylglutathione lyase
MPGNTSADGRFCWFELGTTDQKAAKAFYGSVFGWTPNDTEEGPGNVYTIFKIGKDDVAAAYTLPPEMLKEKIPPHWMVYVRVPNADDAAAKASALGGKVMKSPFDVGPSGRMAVLQDPAGAMFCLWQPKSNPGVTVSGPAGTAVWADLSTPDQMLAAGFYQKLFGWRIVDGKHMNIAKPGDYAHIVNGDDFIGGIPPAEHRDPHMPAHWLTYFEVADYSVTVAKIKSLGGKVHFEHEMKGVRQYAVCADAQGATFAIVKSL